MKGRNYKRWRRIKKLIMMKRNENEKGDAKNEAQILNIHQFSNVRIA